MMDIPVGDYVLEVLARGGAPIRVVLSPHYADLCELAPKLLEESGGQRYRIMRCMLDSAELVKDRWA